MVVAQNTKLPVDDNAFDEFPIVLGQIVLLAQKLFDLLPLSVICGLSNLQRQTKHELFPQMPQSEVKHER